MGRVRLEIDRAHVVVVEDVDLPRGEWSSGSLGVYVAFGAPGTPLGFDAHLIAASTGARDAAADASGMRLPVQLAVRRDAATQLLLGSPRMAGVTVRLPEADLRRAFDASEVAVLRLRSVLAAPAADSGGARDVIVRLGTPEGVPLTLTRIEVVAAADVHVTAAEATLCGPEADAHPLTVALGGRARASYETIAPQSAVRHASDDLRVRWWSSP